MPITVVVNGSPHCHSHAKRDKRGYRIRDIGGWRIINSGRYILRHVNHLGIRGFDLHNLIRDIHDLGTVGLLHDVVRYGDGLLRRCLQRARSGRFTPHGLNRIHHLLLLIKECLSQL
jgi:hypothetical protein